jgi:hypothetical protein
METEQQTAPFLTGKTYDYLKYTAQVFLPAVGTLYFALAAIWGLPSAQEVMGTILAIDAFLGVLLGLSQLQYNKSDARYSGAINMSQTPNGLLYSLELNGDPADIQHQDEVKFKVNPPK